MVKAWKEKVVIPTYEVGKPEKNPIFLEKRVYQGSKRGGLSLSCHRVNVR